MKHMKKDVLHGCHYEPGWVPADPPLCTPTAPGCGPCGGTQCTDWLTRALTSASGRSSQTGDSCPASARRCWGPGSPRDPGRPARSPLHYWSAWSEPACNTGSDKMAERRLGESLFNINIPHVPPTAGAVTATHSVELVKSSFTWHNSAQMSRRSTQCLSCLELLPQLSFILCHLRRCDSRTWIFPLSLMTPTALMIARGGGRC